MRGLDRDRRLRDLYDVYAVLNARDLDFNLLQQTFLAAGAENQKTGAKKRLAACTTMPLLATFFYATPALS